MDFPDPWPFIKDMLKDFLIIFSIILFVICGVVGLGSLVTPAKAHGEAHWIEETPEFLAHWAESVHCCGERDCRREPASSFEVKDGGVLYKPTGTFLKGGQQGLYTSKDQDWWVCDNKWAIPSGVPTILHCIFKPFSGM